MLVLYIILFIYCFAIIALTYGFTKINSFDGIVLKPKTKFSIIVPFRNESDNLPLLLESFSKLNYPTTLFEVILVDDASDFKFQIPNFRFQILMIDAIRMSNSPKKDAISTAIKIVKNEWIITTDADCVVPKNWLLTLDNYIQNNQVAMIAGAVTYHCDNSFLHHFQQLDFASLQGATIGSFGLNKGFMCNGANFAYTQSFFLDLNGFEGNEGIASGDDVFLLQKAMAKSAEKVHYLKSTDHTVITKPVNDWKSLFFQRVRWASKTSSYQSNFGKSLGVIVFAGNLSFIVVIGCLLFGTAPFYVSCFLLLFKSWVDFILIHTTHQFLKTKTQSFLFSSMIYPFFSVGVALYSLFGKYEWKARKFKK